MRALEALGSHRAGEELLKQRTARSRAVRLVSKMPAKENAAEQQQQSQLAAMRSELGEMRRFVRSLLALELAKRTLAVVRVQAGWRAARDRRGVVARAFRARRRLRVLVSTWLLHVSVPAPAGSAALRARLHALGAAQRGPAVRCLRVTPSPIAHTVCD